jgi:DHA2 family multidrug resistance protein
MIYSPQYFKPWIAGWEWGIRIGLWLILLSSLVQFGLFSLTQPYLVGLFGAQPEDIYFAIQLTYVGILSILPVQFRFLRYFETRSYLLFNILAGIVLSILSIWCVDINLFFIIRFLQGVVVGNIAACILTLIFTRLKTEHMQLVGSSVFYGTILSNTVIIGVVAGVVVLTYDWKITLYYLIAFQLFTLLITLFMLNPKAGFKRYPLYLIDWTSFILLAIAAISLAYTMIYGSKYYWFHNSRITTSALAAVVGSVLLLHRQLVLKRPLLNLNVFKSRNFVTGLILLGIYYGLKDSITLIYGYAGSTLKWSTLQVMELGLINLTGLVALLVFSTQLMMHYRHSTRLFLISGFGVMLTYHLWMYFLFTPDLSFNDLIIPVFLQGAASGLLFVPLMIFVFSSAPANTGTTGLVMATFTRFIALLNSFAGFYNLQLYFNQHFKESFLSGISLDDFATSASLARYTQLYQSKGFAANEAAVLASSSLVGAVTQQTQLLTYRAVFMTMVVILAIIITLVICIPAINKTALHWNKRMFTWLRK